MKILFIVHRFHPNLFYPVKALTEAGHEVEMIVPDIKAYETLSEDHSIVRPIKISYSEINKKYVYCLLKEIKPDLILQRHFEGRWKFFSIVSFFMGIKRLVYDQSTHTGNSFIRQYSRPIRRLVNTFMIRKFTPVLNLGRIGKYKEPFSNYIPFPIEPASDIKSKIYTPNNSIRFLTVGKLGQPRKNHIQVIEALEEIGTTCSLTIVGAGSSFAFSEKQYYDKLVRRIEISTIKDGIRIHSDLPYSQMKSIYESHDILIFPAEHESLGQAILEALAYGCPVIVSDNCGASGYVQDGINGFVFECNNLKDLVEKIKFFVDNPFEVGRFGKAAINIAEQIHSPYKFVKSIESLFK